MTKRDALGFLLIGAFALPSAGKRTGMLVRALRALEEPR